jgi:uncharacterized membrane protein
VAGGRWGVFGLLTLSLLLWYKVSIVDLGCGCATSGQGVSGTRRGLGGELILGIGKLIPKLDLQ